MVSMYESKGLYIYVQYGGTAHHHQWVMYINPRGVSSHDTPSRHLVKTI